MSLKLFFSIVVLCWFNTPGASQKAQYKVVKKFVRKINEVSKEYVFQDSVLKQIQSSKDLVIGYSEYNNTWRNVPVCYYLVCFAKRKCVAYKYALRPYTKVGENYFQLDTIDLDQETIDTIITGVKKNKPWEIKHKENDESGECEHVSPEKITFCSISDASSKTLILSTKTHYYLSSYYAPEFYEFNCCPGNKERMLFLSTIAPLFSFFRNASNKIKDKK